MKKLLSCVVLIIVISNYAKAQTGLLKFTMGYNLASPMGSFKTNYANGISPRGFEGDLSYGINNQISLGIGFGFQDFYQKFPRAIYGIASNENVSAVLTNTIQAVPIMAKFTYTPLLGKPVTIQPYFSAGAGVSFNSFNQYLGEFSWVNSSTTNLAFNADGGILIPFKKYNVSSAFQLGVGYQYINFNQALANNLNTINIHVGLILPLRSN